MIIQTKKNTDINNINTNENHNGKNIDTGGPDLVNVHIFRNNREVEIAFRKQNKNFKKNNSTRINLQLEIIILSMSKLYEIKNYPYYDGNSLLNKTN